MIYLIANNIEYAHNEAQRMRLSKNEYKIITEPYQLRGIDTGIFLWIGQWHELDINYIIEIEYIIHIIKDRNGRTN